jgi:hypothetical protein
MFQVAGSRFQVKPTTWNLKLGTLNLKCGRRPLRTTGTREIVPMVAIVPVVFVVLSQVHVFKR